METKTYVNPEDLRSAIKDWIDDSDFETIISLFEENFEGPIHFDEELGLYEINTDEAWRLGLIDSE